MLIIILLLILMLVALFLVSWLRKLQHQETIRRQKQRQLRLKVDALSETAVNLEQLVPNKIIAKHINDLAIAHLQELLALENGSKNHLIGLLHKAEAYSEQLSNEQTQNFYYQRDSDTQIAQALRHINEALTLLPQLIAHGRITEHEFTIYTSQLQWGLLMVPAMSYAAQGDKSKAMSDLFSAQAFYRKAQQLLMSSLINDARRLPLVKELGQMIDGSRTNLSRELIE